MGCTTIGLGNVVMPFEVLLAFIFLADITTNKMLKTIVGTEQNNVLISYLGVKHGMSLCDINVYATKMHFDFYFSSAASIFWQILRSLP